MFCELLFCGSFSHFERLYVCIYTDKTCIEWVLILGIYLGSWKNISKKNRSKPGAQVVTWRLEGHYGLSLLSASSVSGTGVWANFKKVKTSDMDFRTECI